MILLMVNKSSKRPVNGIMGLQAAYLDGDVLAISLPNKSKFCCVFKPKVTTSSCLNDF